MMCHTKGQAEQARRRLGEWLAPRGPRIQRRQDTNRLRRRRIRLPVWTRIGYVADERHTRKSVSHSRAAAPAARALPRVRDIPSARRPHSKRPQEWEPWIKGMTRALRATALVLGNVHGGDRPHAARMPTADNLSDRAVGPAESGDRRPWGLLESDAVKVARPVLRASAP